MFDWSVRLLSLGKLYLKLAVFHRKTGKQEKPCNYCGPSSCHPSCNGIQPIWGVLFVNVICNFWYIYHVNIKILKGNYQHFIASVC